MMNKERFAYLPYTGPEPFLFLRAFKTDRAFAEGLAVRLANHGVRVFYDCIGTADASVPEDVACGILNCDLCVFVLSPAACESMDFRNSVNYAMMQKKKVVCIREDGFVPGYGLDMQLANVISLPLQEPESVYAQLCSKELIRPEYYGEGMRVKDNTNGKRRLLLIFTAVFVIVLALAFRMIQKRISYIHSPDYIFRDIDQAEYLDISMYGPDALSALSGKTIETLNMDGMGIRDISDITGIHVKNVNIAHNPDVATLWYLTQCEGIETVTVSSDMYPLIRDLLVSGINVKMVK